MTLNNIDYNVKSNSKNIIRIYYGKNKVFDQSGDQFLYKGLPITNDPFTFYYNDKIYFNDFTLKRKDNGNLLNEKFSIQTSCEKTNDYIILPDNSESCTLTLVANDIYKHTEYFSITLNGHRTYTLNNILQPEINYGDTLCIDVYDNDNNKINVDNYSINLPNELFEQYTVDNSNFITFIENPENNLNQIITLSITIYENIFSFNIIVKQLNLEIT